MSVSLVIFEDNSVLRESLITLLETSGEYRVVGDFGNVLGVDAVIKDLRPDVVIMDIDMPGRDGISAVPVIRELQPDTAIIMYTQFEDDDKLFKSICAGADGYILKKTSPMKLFEAISEVVHGGAPMSPSIARKMLTSFRENRKPMGQQFDLTKRELEILQLLVKGYSVKMIAAELFIAFDTARTHLKNIYRKLHVNCGKEAIAKVLASKIV
jgi:DNA-binding NarL/FixJ family response regulator